MNNALAWLGLFLTLMVFSYLLGWRTLFRVAVYLLVGVSAGYLGVLLVFDILLPRLLQGDGVTPRLFAALPLALAALLLTRYTHLPRWLSRLPMAWLLGSGAAVVIGGAVFGTLTGQILGFSHVPAGQPVWQTFLLLIGTVSVLLSFQYFLRKPAPGALPPGLPLWLRVVTPLGQAFTGLTLGALFAGLLVTALTALAERWQAILTAFLVLAGGG